MKYKIYVRIRDSKHYFTVEELKHNSSAAYYESIRVMKEKDYRQFLIETGLMVHIVERLQNDWKFVRTEVSRDSIKQGELLESMLNAKEIPFTENVFKLVDDWAQINKVYLENKQGERFSLSINGIIEGEVDSLTTNLILNIITEWMND